MKIRHNCLLYLPTIILLFILWDSKPFAAAAASGTNNNNNNNNGRRKKSSSSSESSGLSSASILEIMNTQEIEKLIAQRRLNNTLSHTNNHQQQQQQEKSNQFITQNDLDEELEYLESTSNSPLTRYKSELRRQHQNHHHNNRNKQNRELFNNDFEYNGDVISSTSHQYHQQQQQQQQHRRFHHNEQKLSSSIPESMELLQYNDTYNSDQRFFTTDQNLPINTLVDSHDLPRGDKILKSSKNALYITRKEYLKKDWCKTEPLVQRIREQGCLTRTFVNRFCYGQCNSFYIPKSPRKRKLHRNSNNNGHKIDINNSGNGKINRYLPDDHFDDEDLTGAAFQSCGFCKPKKYTWITITLRCPSLVPQLRKKRVQRIKQCKCMAEPLE